MENKVSRMGFFDNFSRQKLRQDADMLHRKLAEFRESIGRSFSGVRKDISRHREWIIYLNNIHDSLRKAYDEHRLLTHRDISRINKWLNFLHENMQKQEKAVAELRQNLKALSDSSHHNMDKVYRKVNDLIEREEKLRSMVLTEVKGVKDSHGETRKHVESMMKMIEDAPDVPVIPDSSLTNPEQKLLNLMLSEPDPVSYSSIAEKTGNSINTVRVIMNSLKKRGLVDENVLPSGVKLFSALSREKIKKLYNIQHM